MIIIPFGNDQKRTRFPRLTVFLIVACTANFFVMRCAGTYSEVKATPAYTEMGELYQELFADYLGQRGYDVSDPDDKIFKMKPDDIRELQQDFLREIQNDDYRPSDPELARRWFEAKEDVEQAARSHPDYRLGYVPADKGLLTLFTMQFMHGSWGHLVFNMIFFWLAGANLEDVWGRRYFLAIFLLGGMVATLTHHAIHPDSGIPVIGASGSIAALMGAFTWRFHYAKLKFGLYKWTLWVPAWIALLAWFGREVYTAIQFWGMETNVATWAHIGGFVWGMAAAAVLGLARAEDTFIGSELVAQDVKDKKRKGEADSELAAGADQTHSEEYARAIQERQAGNLASARDLLEQAVRKRPGDIDAWEELIRILFLMGENKGAAARMGALVERLIRAGQLERAMHWYGEIVRRELYQMAGGPWLFIVAKTFADQGAVDQAAYNYRAFAEYCPKDPRAPKALFMAADMVMDKMKSPGQAAAIYELIVQRYPSWMPGEVAAAIEHARRMAGPGA